MKMQDIKIKRHYRVSLDDRKAFMYLGTMVVLYSLVGYIAHLLGLTLS